MGEHNLTHDGPYLGLVIPRVLHQLTWIEIVVGNIEGSKDSVVGWFVGEEIGALVGDWLIGREDRGDKVSVAGGPVGDALRKSLGAVG